MFVNKLCVSQYIACCEQSINDSCWLSCA